MIVVSRAWTKASHLQRLECHYQTSRLCFKNTKWSHGSSLNLYCCVSTNALLIVTRINRKLMKETTATPYYEFLKTCWWWWWQCRHVAPWGHGGWSWGLMNLGMEAYGCMGVQAWVYMWYQFICTIAKGQDDACRSQWILRHARQLVWRPHMLEYANFEVELGKPR